jgi:hypothetical protein
MRSQRTGIVASSCRFATPSFVNCKVSARYACMTAVYSCGCLTTKVVWILCKYPQVTHRKTAHNLATQVIKEVVKMGRAVLDACMIHNCTESATAWFNDSMNGCLPPNLAFAIAAFSSHQQQCVNIMTIITVHSFQGIEQRRRMFCKLYPSLTNMRWCCCEWSLISRNVEF